jgi:hypothetical protein
MLRSITEAVLSYFSVLMHLAAMFPGPLVAFLVIIQTRQNFLYEQCGAARAKPMPGLFARLPEMPVGQHS